MNLPPNTGGSAESQSKTSETILICAKRTDPFARVPKDILDRSDLSFKSKGILSYLLGKPSGWKLRVTDISNHGKDGTKAIRSGLKELRALGYVDLVRLTTKGKVVEWMWKVSDSPIFRKPDAQKAHVENRHLSKKESTKTELTKKQSKETALRAASSFSDSVNQKLGSKIEQLKAIETRFDIPYEREFYRFVEDEGLEELIDGKGGDIYHRLCIQKWHDWNGRRWFPIRDWEAYVRALNTKIEDATTGGF